MVLALPHSVFSALARRLTFLSVINASSFPGTGVGVAIGGAPQAESRQVDPAPAAAPAPESAAAPAPQTPPTVEKATEVKQHGVIPRDPTVCVF